MIKNFIESVTFTLCCLENALMNFLAGLEFIRPLPNFMTGEILLRHRSYS